MANASSMRRRPGRFSSAAGCVAALSGALGCAEVLGIPSDPELVPAASPWAEDAASRDNGRAGSAGAPAVPPPSEPTSPVDAPGGDGVPPREVAGIDSESSALDPEERATPARPTLEPLDAGSDDGTTSGPGVARVDGGVARDAGTVSPPSARADGCEGNPARLPVDIVLIIDNTGSMIDTVGPIESAIPALANELDEQLVDYRVILLSHHRDGERGSSQEADTSVCVAAPLGGAACPSPEPVLGRRFFPYSISIGATNSLSQALASLAAPDPFGLTRLGWSEWLRAGALKLFIDITDNDSTLLGADFVGALVDAAPEHFGDDPPNPRFVFHSVVGLRQKDQELDLYGPDEPIESQVCAGTGSNPTNAGEAYQQLSRFTGGLRQSICPASSMRVRLQVLATDIARRSVEACP